MAQDYAETRHLLVNLVIISSTLRGHENTKGAEELRQGTNANQHPRDFDGEGRRDVAMMEREVVTWL
jgi:hypothetical protein